MPKVGVNIARSVLAAALAATLVPAPVFGQDTRTLGRALVEKWKNAIVNVRIVLKLRMAVGGREMQSTDDTVEAVGTVIDPSGLTVLALGSLNPGGMMSRMMGSGNGGDERVEIISEPTDVRIRLADGTELAASIALRDEDLNLAFIKPRKPPAKPLVAINLADAGRPAILDEVVLLSRLGRVGGWSPSASVGEISAIIDRPRTFFVLKGTEVGMGTPAFLPGGKIVGLLTLRQIDTGRQSMFAGMGGTEGLGLLPVILPAADVLEIAQQAMGKQP
jgi:S1-C subfamily serine protease